MKPVLFAIALCLSMSVAAQQQYIQLRFSPVNTPFAAGKKDYFPSKKGFYLYENCMYDLILRDKKQYQARVIAIKKDSVVFCTAFNKAHAKQQKRHLDTLTIAPQTIQALRLIGDRSAGIYRRVSLRKYRCEFVTDTLPRRLHIDTIALYTNDTTTYELLPYLTDQGLNLLYEEEGYTYYFQGRLTKDSVRFVRPHFNPDTIFRRRHIAWLLPTGVNQINGLAMGLHTGNIMGERLTVNGINTSIDFITMFITMRSAFELFSHLEVKNEEDSLDTDLYLTRLNGISLSMGGTILCHDIRGIALNGGVCIAFKTRGIILSGITNQIHDFKGIVIGGLRNASVHGRGLQIGLVNTCKNFKGLQIGLWNVNGKRKLPFLNW